MVAIFFTYFPKGFVVLKPCVAAHFVFTDLLAGHLNVPFLSPYKRTLLGIRTRVRPRPWRGKGYRFGVEQIFSKRGTASSRHPLIALATRKRANTPQWLVGFEPNDVTPIFFTDLLAGQLSLAFSPLETTFPGVYTGSGWWIRRNFGC